MSDPKEPVAGSRSAAREAFTTIDDCIQTAEELVTRLSRLGAQRHPLGVRKGLRMPMTSNEPSRTLKAPSRTYFFDVRTARDGTRYLLITESRIKDKLRSQITVFPEEAEAFVCALRELIDQVRSK